MLKNTIIKGFSIIIIFILIYNLLAPSIYVYALNDTKNEKTDLINEEYYNETINETSNYIENIENTNNTDIIENTENITKNENNEENIKDNEEPLKNIDNFKENLSNNNIVNIEEKNETEEELSFNVTISKYTINSYVNNNIYYLFLPSDAKLNNIMINYTGNVTNISTGIIDKQNKTITNDFSKNNTINILANNKNYTICVLQSNLPSVSISLKNITLDEINNNSKDIKYQNNSLTLNSKDNEVYNFTDTSVEIKGRGNFTWTLPKKSYQIKLSSKKNVLGMGKAKTWILLANYADSSLMRNKITSDFANDLGLKYTGKSAYIDLWIDGNYQGNYMIMEKVQVNQNRVNLTNNDGLIAEIDNNYYSDESNYFISKKSGTSFVLKDSVADDEDKTNSQSKKAFKAFQDYINQFEEYLYSDNKDWKKISEMIDVESFIKYYFVQEFTEDPDGCRSSLFMYKDGASDKLHMGPIWDYDSSLGNYTSTHLGGNPNIDYVINIKKYMPNSNDWYKELFQIKEFRDLVAQMYNKNIKSYLKNITTNINKYKTELSQSASMNFIRWNTLGNHTPFNESDRITKNTYNEEVQYLSDWVTKRENYLNKRYSKDSDIFKVKYTSHIEGNGWNNSIYSTDGELSGTEGKSKRLEAIKIYLDTFNEQLSSAKISYQVHVQEYGWMNWKSNGEVAGTEGQSKRLEAIRIKLENADNYNIQYRVHIQNIGWQDWKQNGEVAGTEGQSLRIEAIQIKITEAPKNVITYNTHVQYIGWQPNVLNGNISGTTGQSLRLEGIKINILNNSENIRIKYSTHIQNIGWQNWKYNGELSGTEGQSLRLEAIKIELEGNQNYNIKYRVHVQYQGWQDWKQNGEIAGTEGQSLRLEAIQIKLEKK